MGRLILTSALHDVKKDPAIVDHLFVEVFFFYQLYSHIQTNRELLMHLQCYPLGFYVSWSATYVIL